MKIEFIDYTGSYPCLCMGELTLRIDGEFYKFGGEHEDDHCYPSFWLSGGATWFDADWEEHVEQGPWELEEDNLPEFLKPHGQELINLFNENVYQGCCGGCI